MKTNSNEKNLILIQIKDAYGKVLYTYTCHNKMISRLKRKIKFIKYIQIVLSAISTGGFLGVVFGDELFFTIIGGLFSTTLLAINLFFKDFLLGDEIAAHSKVSNDLWLIREKYVSFMTDFSTLSIDQIRIIRDKLQNETYNIYSSSPRTDKRSYEETRKALKIQGEQFFSNDELNQILPIHLRVSD